MNVSQVKIIDYLKQHNIATANDLALYLHKTSANTRHHLQILQANGVVEIFEHRHVKGRGHPVYLYRLNAAYHLHNLAGLVNGLLRVIYSQPLNLASADLMQSLADQLALQFPVLSGSLAQRLSKAVQELQALNYEPRWEARREGPRFMFANCPYASILESHPELCQMDGFLLGRILKTEAAQVTRIGTGTPPARYCLFSISDA